MMTFMETSAELKELHLNAFKGFKQQVLPIGETTILIGRNSSGKSNALDALETLSRLATGDTISDALDAPRRDGEAIRGGSEGLAPHGKNSFSLGCKVSMDEWDHIYTIEIEVGAESGPRIIREELKGPGLARESGDFGGLKVLFSTREPEENTGSIEAEYHNGKRGSNPHERFADNRLVLKQFIDRYQYSDDLGIRSAVQGAHAVRVALLAVFHLDPVPYLMRDYVRERPATMYRTGQNISAVLKFLKDKNLAVFEHIEELTRDVVDDNIIGLDFIKTEIGEVMLALKDKEYLTPAREMSDGLLRFLAVAATLLQEGRALDIESPYAAKRIHEESPIQGGVLAVIEELENGVHPSQASRLLSMVEESGNRKDFKVLVTTHSPALLDAAEGRLNNSIVVCYRDPKTGLSVLKPLVDFLDYAQVLAGQSLGSAVTQDEFRDEESTEPDYTALNQLLGI